MTHDAKRSADVRARIGALTHLPDQWATHVERWFELTESLRRDGAPDDAERYFIFQTLAGSWPIESERIEAYMEKALREAKRNTNWVEQNQEWEEAVKSFCRSLYSERAFLDDFEPFVSELARLGRRSAQGQLALKLTAPGIPDIYQGDELPYRALVDPDNRRPVDWDWRQAMLRRLMGGSPPDQETAKLFMIMRLLGLRGRRPDAFASASYEPLEAGPDVCAFLRGGEVLVLVAVRPEPGDATFEAPGGIWRDVLRGEQRGFSAQTRMSEVLGARGAAIFERV
jgi:(1->4)-alpha-D-glucan 1-alpha-D-glucosylmutase